MYLSLLRTFCTVKLPISVFVLFFVTQATYAQFDTIPTNKAPKATYATWKYSIGVTDITDNFTGHSASSAFELKAKNVDVIYAPTVRVTSNGNVTGTVKFNLVNYQESTSAGKVSVSVLVDGGTSSAITFSEFTTATGTNSWASFSFSGNFLSGTHTYTAFFSNPSNNSIAIDDLNFGFTGATSVTLPVSLNSFTAASKGNTIALNWSTLTENSNRGFYVQRSNDRGNTFSDVAFETTKAVNGNSNYTIAYGYIDATPNDGENYYRLKQTDVDGKLSYSAVVSSIVKNVVSLKIYPNPVVDNITISGADNGTVLKIINVANGQTVLASTISSSNLDVSTLLPGYYILETIVKQTLQTLKFIKQ